MVSGQPVNNVLHAILTLFMCGLWLPVWLILAATGGERRNTISVDEWGQLNNDLRPMHAPKQASTGQAALIVFGCFVGLLILFEVVLHLLS